MNNIGKCKFELDGELFVKGLLEPEYVQKCLAAVDAAVVETFRYAAIPPNKFRP